MKGNVVNFTDLLKPATEETLQSIDATLKRIEVILRQGLLQNQFSVSDVRGLCLQQLAENSVELYVESK